MSPCKSTAIALFIIGVQVSGAWLSNQMIADHGTHRILKRVYQRAQGARHAAPASAVASEEPKWALLFDCDGVIVEVFLFFHAAGVSCPLRVEK